MRHASIQTTMNVYGKAMTDSKKTGTQQRRSNRLEKGIAKDRRPLGGGKG
jgi:hypothetical protein